MISYKVGDLAEKYETGEKGPGFISNGASWGDPGGDSYGSYQLETKKGTMQEYLKGVNDPFVNELKILKINSTSFKTKWAQLAAKDPIGFQQSQFNFLANKKNGFYDAIKYAKSLGWATNNTALQAAIFSTSNQSGGWKIGIFDKANIKANDDIKDQINKLYDARAAYFNGLSSLSSSIRKNILQARTINERKDCLKLLDN